MFFNFFYKSEKKTCFYVVCLQSNVFNIYGQGRGCRENLRAPLYSDVTSAHDNKQQPE